MKKSLFLSMVVFITSNILPSSAQALIIFDGESNNPNYVWEIWRTPNEEYRHIRTQIANPKKDATNSTDYCAAFTRMKADPEYISAAVEKLNIDATQYDSISFMVYKDIPGRVQLEIKDINGDSYWYKIENRDDFVAGQWNKFAFPLHEIRANIEAILIAPHLQDESGNANWTDQMVYFDQILLYNEGASNTNYLQANRNIVSSELYSINGHLLQTFGNESYESILSHYPQGTFILKQIDDQNYVSITKIITRK